MSHHKDNCKTSCEPFGSIWHFVKYGTVLFALLLKNQKDQASRLDLWGEYEVSTITEFYFSECEVANNYSQTQLWEENILLRMFILLIKYTTVYRDAPRNVQCNEGCWQQLKKASNTSELFFPPLLNVSEMLMKVQCL